MPIRHRGVGHKEAERRAWATVNKETHGGKPSGSGRGTEEDHAPSRKGGRLVGIGEPSGQREIGVCEKGGQDQEAPRSLTVPRSPIASATGGLQAVCDVCGNDYDKAFRITQAGKTMTFDKAPDRP
jgi:hypothetical protein